MTTAEILSLSRKKLLEESSEILDDTTLLIYANLAQNDIKKRTFTNDQIQTATIILTSGIGTLPSDFGTLYGDAYTSDNKFYPELPIADFNKKTLPYSVTIENDTLKVYPTSLGSINIKYYPTYTDISSTVDSTLNPYFHELIVYGILSRAFEDLQDEQLAKYYDQKYEIMINKKSNIQSNYEEDNQRGSQLFVEQNLIPGSNNTDVNHF